MSTSETVWQEYHWRLRAFIRSRVADDAAADDLLQTVFLKIHTGLQSLKDEAKLRSWLYQIARNATVDYYRAKTPTAEIPESLAHPQNDPSTVVTQELAQCLEPMIAKLPEKYRRAIVLSEIEGLTQKELAETEGLSLSGAKSRVQRGRALLKEMLSDCCRIEFDHGGRLRDYEQKDGIRHNCCPPGADFLRPS